MSDLNSLFDSEHTRVAVTSLLESLAPEERNQWLHHPCTKALIRTMEADYIDYHKEWESGNLTSENAEGTAQKNAKALGALEYIRLLEEWIRLEVKHVSDEGTSDSSQGR